MHRRTVRFFLRSEELPIRQIGFRRSSLTRFVPFLEKRWAEGCRNAAQLWCEIKEQGFPGSDSAVRHFLQSWREPIPEESRRGFVNITGISRQPPSARQTGWLLFRPDLCQKDWHREYAEELCGASHEIETAKNLTGEFYELMKNGKSKNYKNGLIEPPRAASTKWQVSPKESGRTYRQSKRQSKCSGATGKSKGKSIV